jgi:hypothetical protein
MQELIIQPGSSVISELVPMLDGEKTALKTFARKKLLRFWPVYLTLVAILGIGWFRAREGGATRNAFIVSEWTEEDKARVDLVAPYFLGFLFIALTIYFYRIYRKTIHPILKDIQNEKMEVRRFKPEKYQTPFFEEYFLVTDLPQKRLIKITKEGFYLIHENSKASVYIAPNSKLLFSVKIDQANIEFTDNAKMPDM